MKKYLLALLLYGVLSTCVICYCFMIKHNSNYQNLIRYHGNKLEQFGKLIPADKYGSHLKYMPLPDDLGGIGLRAYWYNDGFVFFVLDQKGEVDEPTEVIVYDTQRRGNVLRTLTDLYPSFVIYNLSVTQIPGWYYYMLRK